MLKCFDLKTTLDGLTMLLEKTLGSQDYIVTTVVLDQETGDILKELVGKFDFTEISSDEKVTLFTIDIKDRGSIILDLFNRGDRLQAVSQVSTMTERGSSLLKSQTGVSYVVAHLPKVDLQYLAFDQVKTLFHEFGHAMNISLSTTKY